MSERCGCCEGIEVLTPRKIANRPGLNSLVYRTGTHATFLHSMKARLSSGEHPALAALATRDDSDPAVALLDAWATVGDVLTFYQERIANEGYLRTAAERRSIFELARLVGYQPRPGVSASVDLAFTMQDGYDGEIPSGTRAQSVPRPGEQPQSFETSGSLEARAAWNVLTPRLSRPQSVEQIATLRLYFKGIDTGLGPNDRLLVDLGQRPLVLRVEAVEPDRDADHTLVTLQRPTPSQLSAIAEEGRLREDATNTLQTTLATARDRRREEEDDDTGLVARFNRLMERISDYLWPELDPERREETAVDPEPVEDLPRLLRGAAVRLQEALVDFQRLEASTAEVGDGAPENLLEDLRREIDLAVDAIGELRAIDTLRMLRTGVSPAARSLESSRVRRSAPPSLDVRMADLLERTPTTLSRRLPGLAQAFGGPSSSGVEATLQPMSAMFRYSRTDMSVLACITDTSLRTFRAMEPKRGEALFATLEYAASGSDLMKIYALRVTASLFGNTAPRPAVLRREGEDASDTTEWPLEERPNVVTLDGPYRRILPGSLLALERASRIDTGYEGAQTPPADVPTIARADAITERSRAGYGITSARSTEVTLDRDWLRPEDDFDVIRRTTVHAESELLELAEVPIEEPTENGWKLEPVGGREIELDSWQEGLEAGRWLIVSGEREDLTGVVESELVMLAGVEHCIDLTLPGDRMVSTLLLAGQGLTHSYRRETVRVHANVARATHGETRTEVLGSGDSSMELQRFNLRQSPLTYLAAPTPSGAQSTLKAFVNGVRWHETKTTLARLKPTDRRYATQTNDVDATTVLFGDGEHGARLPTGTENVEAVYRTGLGAAGNVDPGQISQLATRALGLSGVTNPLGATGGADRETLDGARRNAPLAVTALDRLVSVRDYADFARSFAGIGKAHATRLQYRSRSLVHLTIAGRDDIPIARDSDVYLNLLAALRRWGDPRQLIRVDPRELKLMVVSAGVRLMSDHQWDVVEPRIRSALLEEFAFERRELGQDVELSEVTSAIQRVPGVAYVDVDVFGRVAEKVGGATGLRLLLPGEIASNMQNLESESRRQGRPWRRIDVELVRLVNGSIRPAQIAFLTPKVPETLILKERIS
jgi:predicted phage baseplate assembly protein